MKVWRIRATLGLDNVAGARNNTGMTDYCDECRYEIEGQSR
jgi:hypothetical protein